ncbi:Serine/threonine-protein kinase AfsK [Nonomuraea coxensis DSM 45129]|uniref:Serine/threonine-protein kinase AfsK n=1 Tax=Nonomuraea coxensis DSM 45129 TaxID=1122611 RepID=A0ABX8UAU2_9ACTN|nr:serine/threonine protein kinase [Nonomuraea coxensis]QYC43959.1 Serine/threonine-protein kinase AfsK [Nonomuraea coxensis DSM 45129]
MSKLGKVGPYTLVERLGRGGMGEVYLATTRRGERIALKVLHDLAEDETSRVRLEREVRALRRVESPYVAKVLDADLNCARPYLVMEHIEGATLLEKVRQDGPLDVAELVEMAQGIAAALAIIHAAGVVHRDLKPGNIIMSARGPVLIDFGIAQVLDATRLTMTGTFLGTPGYTAPEIFADEQVDSPADVHAWAATVAFAATGRPTFGRGTAEAQMYAVLNGQADLKGVPVELLPLVRAALNREPGKRPTAALLADRLSRLARVTSATETDAGGEVAEEAPPSRGRGADESARGEAKAARGRPNPTGADGKVPPPRRTGGDRARAATDGKTPQQARGRTPADGAAVRGRTPADGGAARGRTPADGAAARGRTAADGTAARGRTSAEGAAARGRTPADGAAARGRTPADGAAARGRTPADGAAARGRTPVDGAAARGRTTGDGGAARGRTPADGAVARSRMDGKVPAPRVRGSGGDGKNTGPRPKLTTPRARAAAAVRTRAAAARPQVRRKTDAPTTLPAGNGALLLLAVLAVPCVVTSVIWPIASIAITAVFVVLTRTLWMNHWMIRNRGSRRVRVTLRVLLFPLALTGASATALVWPGLPVAVASGGALWVTGGGQIDTDWWQQPAPVTVAAVVFGMLCGGITGREIERIGGRLPDLRREGLRALAVLGGFVALCAAAVRAIALLL